MGVYWSLVNHTKKEFIEPPNPSFKWPDIIYGDNIFPKLSLYVLKRFWKRDRIELFPDYLTLGDDYKNMTTQYYKDAQEEYSFIFSHNLN